MQVQAGIELTRQQAGNAQPGSGLRNATGEYNCFLNVIVQCLWYCSTLRQAVLQWPARLYQVGQSHVSVGEVTTPGL